MSGLDISSSSNLGAEVSQQVLRFPSVLEGEPFDERKTKSLIREILKEGVLSFSGHAKIEMQKDSLQTTDVQNVLRAGWCRPAEMENRTWRYRFETNRMSVVVAFRSERRAVVVTAWRSA